MVDKNQDLAVKILPYDSKVREIFEEIKRFLNDIIPYMIEVEHIGSTAVPGLGGKGIIDILIVTQHQHQLPEIAEILRNKGFSHNPEPKHAEDRFFVSGPYRYKGEELHIHIHITFSGSKEHKDKLLFRDYLRRHLEEARTYFELKKRWSMEAGSDPSKYTELKTLHINRILEKARREEEEDRCNGV